MLIRFYHLSLLLCGFAAASLSAAENQPIFVDAMQSGWENWSWAQTSSSKSPVHGGAASLVVTADAWEAAYFHSGSTDVALYTNLSFWIHGGPKGGQKLLLQGLSSGKAKGAFELPVLAADTWQQVTVSLQQLGVAGDPAFDGFWVQDRTGLTQSAFYLDDIALLGRTDSPSATNSSVEIRIDAAFNRHPISEHIYGVAFASTEQLQQLNSPANRSGGNAETRYNWQINARNRAFDWYFESLPESSSTAAAEADDFITSTKTGGATPMLTIPMIGWVAKLGPNRTRLSSFSIAKYGAQTDRDAQWFPDAGNGISAANNQPITNNDPNDANLPINSSFQQDFIRHLTNRWGSSGSSGMRYYFLDNEPSIWHGTHRDVFKTGLRMSELRDRAIEYASKIREIDPRALILGPEEWGWSGYLYSGYDQQWGSTRGWNNLPDRAANGGTDYLPWFLDQMRRHEEQTGRRLLDVFTVHYYPQGGEFNESGNVSSAMQFRRNRSTRSLWDPNYTDQSWINDKVRLIPRLKQWVAQYYPGTRIGLTEYNWGADDHINGATAQADILGILGREGADFANRWTTPATTSPTFKAFQIYRNYDGRKSTFGETSISATSPNPDNISTFASLRSSDGALTLMAINKITMPVSATIALTNFTPGSLAKAWRLDSANKITALSDLPTKGNVLTNLLPAQSITLFVVSRALAAAPARLQVAPIDPLDADSIEIGVTAEAGANYRVEESIDLSNWIPEEMITMTSEGTAQVTRLLDSHNRFYRLAR